LIKKHGNITNELAAKVTNQGHASSFKPNYRSARKHTSKNFKQIFFLSFDALKDRKARSALTILMVVVGSALMVALNGMSAGQATFLNKQLNTLAPDIIFVSSGQNGFRAGSSSTPTIVLNSQVVNRLKSLSICTRCGSIIPRTTRVKCAGKYLKCTGTSYGSSKNISN